MEKTNGQGDPRELDVEHELPSGGEDAAGTCALDVELEKVKEERDAAIERLARAQAEFDNSRRRAARELQDYRDYALTDAIKSLLPILDSFDRALASGASGEEFRSGMELIDRQLHDALRKLGVIEVEAEGQQFDPTVHEAIQTVETSDVPDNQVIQELQRGYKLKGRLLRPAMVRVARNKENQ